MTTFALAIEKIYSFLEHSAQTLPVLFLHKLPRQTYGHPSIPPDYPYKTIIFY